jgi:hypothetical protein
MNFANRLFFVRSARGTRVAMAQGQSPRENAMRTQHLLLLSSIVLSGPVLAAEPKPTADVNGKSGADAAKSTGANDEMMQERTSRKDRVRYTFPPSAKRR